jgi:hypothetical protein
MFYFRLEKEKQLIKSAVDEAKLQTDQANKAKVIHVDYLKTCLIFRQSRIEL